MDSVGCAARPSHVALGQLLKCVDRGHLQISPRSQARVNRPSWSRFWALGRDGSSEVIDISLSRNQFGVLKATVAAHWLLVTFYVEREEASPEFSMVKNSIGT